ncbi:UPF0392 protein [Seminavis robusta]|uniref:UPF0392 protein n=1 Tax=Seminavis robusta TaxID=568900 RepID=A0A9N8H8V3_9STRA|nr:UPF0392 protein [Seminavis robusta]|eukprot:Sro232_g093850.1 UPF0392 protein (535) ;mRNA; r:33368-34972
MSFGRTVRLISPPALLAVLIVAANIRIFNGFLERAKYSGSIDAVDRRIMMVRTGQEDGPSDSAAANNISAATQCRLDLDSWQNANIDRWMDSKAPWMEWIWAMNDKSTGQRYWLVILLTIDTGIGNYFAPRLNRMEWMWQDSSGNNHTATPVFTKRLKQPRNDRVYLRLDLPPTNTYSSDNNNNNNNHTQQQVMATPKYLWPDNDELLQNTTYHLEPYLQCSNLERRHKPPPHVKVGACITRFWGQHDLLPEWIEYHRLIGVQHFWLFVSEPFENVRNNHKLPHNNNQDVTYIPYHYTWARHQHKRPNATLKFGGESMFQAAAINQCLYLAKQYDLDWIYTPDVDEYVAVLDPELLVNNSQAPLPAYLERTFAQDSDPATLGQVCMEGVAFGRNKLTEPLQDKNENASTSDQFQLTIDFTYRLNRTKGSTGGRRKCFYRPAVVNDAWVHLARDGGRSINTDPNQVDLYHYRSPLLGVFQHKGTDADLVSYPEIRDRYRDKILAALYESNALMPNFAAHVDLGYNSTPPHPQKTS